MLLAQHGAQVIKIERPGDGDWSRVLGVRYGDHSAFSIVGNLGKRAVAIDLKHEEGKAVLWRLLAGADVFIEGFRPGVIKRLGFDYEAVSAREPGLVYLSISGFGQNGPLVGRPAMDPVLQAFTGLTGENHGEDGIPHRVPVIPIDMATALFAFMWLCPCWGRCSCPSAEIRSPSWRAATSSRFASSRPPCPSCCTGTDPATGGAPIRGGRAACGSTYSTSSSVARRASPRGGRSAGSTCP